MTSRILFATLPLTGHTLPGLPIARALAARGHEVFWYTGKKFRKTVEDAGARFVAMRKNRDFDDGDLDAAFAGRSARGGIGQLAFDMKHVFIDPMADQVADLLALQAELGFDLMVHDVGFVGMHVFAERSGMRHVTFGVTALPFPSRDTAPFGLGIGPASGPVGRLRNRLLYALVDGIVLRSVHAHYRAQRRKLGLGPGRTGHFLSDASHSHAFLQASVPGFEYPRSDLPAHVEFIGPFLPAPGSDYEPPAWWHELSAGRPVVHVTQGTAATRSEQLLVPTLEALADEDVLVVAATGGKPVTTLAMKRVPDNARVVPFVPYAHFLPFVSVMVTNAGYGGVQGALAHGIPLVAAGDSEDKPEIATRIAWSGAGIDLRTATPSQPSIRKAVRAVLHDGRYRRQAERLRDEMARYDAAQRAVQVIEGLTIARPS